MPFTFSHPAIVLPLALKRFRLSATGLVIGSMVPDFEYFLRMTDRSRYSHTLLGLFWFDLPLGVLICFVYHVIVRNSLFDNLPIFLKERVIIFKSFQWPKYFSKRWVIVCVCILIGAASHVLWDAFTHETMFFVRKDPELSNIMRVGRINLAGYKFLQLSSSLIGLLIVIIVIVTLKKYPANNKIDYKYWMLVVLIIMAVMFIRFVRGLDIHDHRSFLISLISSTMIALILAPMISTQQERIHEEHVREQTQ